MDEVDKEGDNNNDDDMKDTNNEEKEQQQQNKSETNSSSQASLQQQQPKLTVISPEKMQQLTLMKTFHNDAVKFILQLHTAMPLICQLLSSKSKPEVLEAMELLVTAHEYKVKLASVKIIIIRFPNSFIIYYSYYSPWIILYLITFNNQ